MSEASSGSVILPDWFSVEDDRWIVCGRCDVSVDVTGMRHGPMREGLVKAFITQHAVHDKKGVASGLTPTGRTSKAAAQEIARWRSPRPQGATS